MTGTAKAMGYQFTWGDLTVTVKELNRADTFKASTEFDVLLGGLMTEDDKTPIWATTEINWILASHSPCIVRYKGELLPNGAHVIGGGDDTFILTLPLTRECLDLIMPASLSVLWSGAAWEANRYLANELFLALARITQTINAPKSESA